MWGGMGGGKRQHLLLRNSDLLLLFFFVSLTSGKDELPAYQLLILLADGKLMFLIKVNQNARGWLKGLGMAQARRWQIARHIWGWHSLPAHKEREFPDTCICSSSSSSDPDSAFSGEPRGVVTCTLVPTDFSASWKQPSWPNHYLGMEVQVSLAQSLGSHCCNSL